jgi:hypothetical protein
VSFFDRVAATAATQHGAVTRAQILAAGATARRLRTLQQQGVVSRAARGIYVLAGAPPTWEQDVIVAALASSPSAVASHRTAAALWHLDRFRRRHVEVSTEGPAPRRPTGAVVHESTLLPARDRTAVSGIPVTSPTRTLIDMGRFVGTARLGAMVDDAVRRELTSYEALQLRFAELAGRGRDGIATIREVLEDRPGGATVPDSPLEDAARATLAAAGLPAPVLHHRVRCDEIEYVLDLAWTDHLVALECDGFRFHRTPDDLDWDDRRRTELGLRGWLVLHTTWNHLRDEPSRLVRDVRTALEQRSGGPVG